MSSDGASVGPTCEYKKEIICKTSIGEKENKKGESCTNLLNTFQSKEGCMSQICLQEEVGGKPERDPI